MILLDTQVVYWSMVEPERLGRRARSLISSTAVRYISSITHVEFAIKEMRGKLHVPAELMDGLAAAGFEGLPFSERHVAGLSELPSLAGHDPFDRMLIAQARADRLDFLTADRTLLALDQPWIIDATS